MYKLDPDYVCIVKKRPQLSVITKAEQLPQTPQMPRSPIPPLRFRIQKIVPEYRKASQKPTTFDDSDSDSDASEVDGMIVDEMDYDLTGRRMHAESEILKKVRKNKAEARRFRRSKNAQFKRDHPPRFEQEEVYHSHVSPDIRMMTPQGSFTEVPPSPPNRPESPSPQRQGSSLPTRRKRSGKCNVSHAGATSNFCDSFSRRRR